MIMMMMMMENSQVSFHRRVLLTDFSDEISPRRQDRTTIQLLGVGGVVRGLEKWQAAPFIENT